MIAILFFACQSTPHSPDDALAPESASPTEEGPSAGNDSSSDITPNASPNSVTAREFVVALPAGPLELNPILSYTATEAQLFTALFEGLVTYHPLDLEPVPAVAERWEVSPDGRTYTFYLRPNARYWNGDLVVAEHFRDSWLKLIAPETRAAYNFLFDVIAGAREYRTGVSTDPQSVGIAALSDTVLEVRLVEPATHFLKILCHHSFVPVHPSVRERRDWSDLATVPGNGPFFLVERGADEWMLNRNELYWGAREVELDRIRVRFFDDDQESAIMRGFNGGEIHWITSGASLDQVQFPQQIVINPMFATSYLFMRADYGPFVDPRVRRALALLVPWEEIRNPEILYIPARTLVPPIPHYPELETIHEPQPDEAKQLLADAGYSQGVRLPSLRIFLPAATETERVARILKNAWESQLEVSVEITLIPYGGYFDRLKTEEYTVGMVSWIGDFADPMAFLQMWLSGSNVNDAGFADPEYDALIDESMRRVGQARYNTLARAEEILLRTGTVMPMSHSPAINLIDLQSIEGWFPNPLDIHPFRYLRFAEFTLPPGTVRAPRFDQRAPNWYTAAND